MKVASFSTFLTRGTVLGLLCAGTALATSGCGGVDPSQPTANPVSIVARGITAPGGPVALTGDDKVGNEYVQGDLGGDIPKLPTRPGTPDRTPGGGTASPASAGRGVHGWNGLTHFDQRTSGTGKYTNTQFSLEPPDQGLCVGHGKVMELVNDALAIYDSNGKLLSGPTPISQFFNLAPEVIRSTPPVFGDFVSDPKCYFDADTNRWFITVLQQDPAPSVRSHTELAVSATADPTKGWNLFSIDATDDGNNGTPSHPGCPCFGDQPLIGADEHGFYITTNEFGAGFNGAQIYALNKKALAAGGLPNAVHFDNLSLAEGIAYSVQPATTPPDGKFARGHGGTEFFLSALQFGPDPSDNRIAVWSLTNTRSLSSTPALTLQKAIVTSEIYTQPSPAVQKVGPIPYGTSQGQPESLINSNDDRMNQTVYVNGLLYSGLNTAFKDSAGVTRVAIAYFIVRPHFTADVLTGSIHDQGYVSVDKNNVMCPSIAVNGDGDAAMGFTLVGPDYFPSAAYVRIDGGGKAADVKVVSAGAAPEDGFTGYDGGGVSRWGDYSAAVADEHGNLWMATEYIPNLPRTTLANWGTFIARVNP